MKIIVATFHYVHVYIKKFGASGIRTHDFVHTVRMHIYSNIFKYTMHVYYKYIYTYIYIYIYTYIYVYIYIIYICLLLVGKEGRIIIMYVDNIM